MKRITNNLFFILSPFLLLIITQTIAIVFRQYLKANIYILIILIYWVIITSFILLYGYSNISIWLKKPKSHWIWLLAAILMGFSSLPLFLSHFRLLSNLSILVPHIIFFIINPWLEEFYWRGLIIDAIKKWPIWISIIYSSILFTMWHSAFSWYSVMTRSLSFYLPVLIMGIIMSIIYIKTKSLWICIFSHMLINIFNMSIPVLLNMIEI